MKKIKKLGSATLLALLSLSCTTTKTMQPYVLFVGTSDGTIKRWQISNDGMAKELLPALKGHKKKITALTVSPNGKHLFSGDDSGNVNVWDILDQENIQKSNSSPKRHKESVLSAVFSPDSERLISQGWDGTINLSIANQYGEFEPLTNFVLPENWRTIFPPISFSPDGRHIVLVGRLQPSLDIIVSRLLASDLKKIPKGLPIKKWDKVQLIKGHKGPIFSAVLSPYYNYLAFGETIPTKKTGELKTWNISSQQDVFDISGDAEKLQTLILGKKIPGKGIFGKGIFGVNIEPDVAIDSLQFSNNYRLLVAGVSGVGISGVIKILEFKNGKFKVVNDIFAMSDVQSVAFSPDDQYLAAGNMDGNVRIWRISEKGKKAEKIMQRPLLKVPGPVSSLAFWPKPKPKFHLKDPVLQEEKIELLRELELLE